MKRISRGSHQYGNFDLSYWDGKEGMETLAWRSPDVTEHQTQVTRTIWGKACFRMAYYQNEMAFFEMAFLFELQALSQLEKSLQSLRT